MQLEQHKNTVFSGLAIAIVLLMLWFFAKNSQQFQIQNVARNTEYKTLLPCSSPSKIKKN
jgi:hypothetical protein